MATTMSYNSERWQNHPKYGVVITENLLSSQWGGHLVSLVNADEDVENGMFGHVGTKLENERELSEFVAPDATTITTRKAVLIASPPEIFAGVVPSNFGDDNFINYAGNPMRGYGMQVGDEFAITEYTIDTLTPYDPDTKTSGATKGNYVTLQAGSNRGIETATLPSTNATILEIIDVDSSPLRPYTMILGKRPARFVALRVVKNGV